MFAPAPRIKRRVSASKSIPAPVGGLNARDALSEMPITDALVLRDWYCSPSEVVSRAGWKKHCDNITGEVESLFAWNGTASKKLFAAAGTAFYDVTATSGAPSTVVTGLTNARWQSAGFSNTSGNYIFVANGVDKMHRYNGTTWLAMTTGVDITGVASTDIVNVSVHKRRLWMVLNNSMSAYYLATDAISGAAVAFDFGPIFPRGGYLMATATWTIDSGAGADDFFVVLTSEGEAAVYAGTDPSAAATWSLVGVYYIGSPIGRRCFDKFGGDLLVLCQQGIFPLSKAMQSTVLDKSSAFTDKIQSLFVELTTLYGTLFGWDVFVYTEQSLIILNVPQVSADENIQYAMNIISGAWSEFSNIPSRCNVLFGGRWYFGGNGYVALAWEGTKDAVERDGTGGEDIFPAAQQAFTAMGEDGQNKRVTMMRPTILSQGIPTLNIGVVADFDLSQTVVAPASASSVGVAIWDSSLWDVGVWVGNDLVFSDWISVICAPGYYFSVQMILRATGTCRWVNTAAVWEVGGVV